MKLNNIQKQKKNKKIIKKSINKNKKSLTVSKIED